MNAHGGNAGFHKKIFEDHLKTLIADEGKAALREFTAGEQSAMTAKARASACEEFLACFFIRASDDNRYKGLKQALDNEHLMSKGAYPRSMVDALKLLKNDVVPGNKKHEAHSKGEESGVAFAQTRGARDLTHVVCFSCGKKGHLAESCPDAPDAKEKLRIDKAKAKAFEAKAKAKAKVAVAHVAVEEEDDDVELDDDGKPMREALLDMMGFVTIGVPIDVSGIDLLETGTQNHPKKVSFADIV